MGCSRGGAVQVGGARLAVGDGIGGGGRMVVDGIRGGGVVVVKGSVGVADVMVDVVGMSSYPSTHRESQLCIQRKRRRTIGLPGQRATQTIGRLWHSSALKVTRVAS